MQEQLKLDLFDSEITENKIKSEIITLSSGEIIPDGEIIIYRKFFDRLTSDRLFEDLLNNINWRQDKIKFYGKEFNVPRLTAWYGDEGKSYKYSGIEMNPDPWIPTLITIKEKIERAIEIYFNSVLINLYRHGKDSVSWHSDDEPELGKNPIIASVSFGSTRIFHLKHKFNKNLETIKIPLTHGSLLIMKGTTQHYWQHQIPKTSKKIAERINLTFRIIK